MPPIEPTQYIRTLKLTMLWSAGMAGAPDEIKHVCDALNAQHVQIEREIEDCIDDGLCGKGLEDANTRVRITALVNVLQLELSVQITFASLVAETVDQVMLVAQKVDECAGAVLRSHTKRIDARVTEQQRQVKLVRTPAKVVPVIADKPARIAPSAGAQPLQWMVWLTINMIFSLMALAGVVILFLMMLSRR